MNSISDLKKLFNDNGMPVDESHGWYLISGKDKYTIDSEVVYKNNEPISKKDLLAFVKKKK